MLSCYIIVRENCYQLLLPLGAILPKNRIGAHFSVTTHGSRSCRIIHYFWKLSKVNFHFLIFFSRKVTHEDERERNNLSCVLLGNGKGKKHSFKKVKPSEILYVQINFYFFSKASSREPRLCLSTCSLQCNSNTKNLFYTKRQTVSAHILILAKQSSFTVVIFFRITLSWPHSTLSSLTIDPQCQKMIQSTCN